MAANNTHDILIAETLGDVVKLRDEVADLRVELPKILNQMHAFISTQTANAEVLQEPTQRAIQSYIRQELKGAKQRAKLSRFPG